MIQLHTPPAFREDRVEVLHDLITRWRFATLVTMGADGILASHIPMLLDPLRGHVARGNPQWRDLAARSTPSPPFTYISP